MTDAHARAEDPRPHGGALRGSLLWLELVLGLALVAILWIYLDEAGQLPRPMNPSDVGAGRFPTIVGVATIVAVALMIGLGIARLRRGGGHHPVTVHRPVWVLVAAGLLVAQAALFEVFGALAGVAGFSFLLMLVAGERRPLHLIATPALLTAGLYVTFVLALGVRLP